MVNKKQIHPAVVSIALQKLTKINQFYSNITIDNEWKDLTEQLDLMLWKLLTDNSTRESSSSDQTDSNDDTEGNDKFKERELKESSSPFATVMRNIDGPNISPRNISPNIVNIAPGECQIPVVVVFLLQDLIGKHLHFLKTILQQETALTGKEELQ